MGEYKKPKVTTTLFPNYYLLSYKTPSGEEVIIGRYNPNFSLSELIRHAERKVPKLYFPNKD